MDKYYAILDEWEQKGLEQKWKNCIYGNKVVQFKDKQYWKDVVLELQWEVMQNYREDYWQLIYDHKTEKYDVILMDRSILVIQLFMELQVKDNLIRKGKL